MQRFTESLLKMPLRLPYNAGFVLVGTSDVLVNPEDDHTLGPFDPSLGRRTDRFVLKFEKPRIAH